MSWFDFILVAAGLAVVAYLVYPPFRSIVKGWKIVIVGVLTGLTGVAEEFDWTQVVSSENAGWIMLGVGVLVVLLRAVTTTPLGMKE